MVPESARVWMVVTEWFERGADEFIVVGLCLMILLKFKAMSDKQLSPSPPCQPFVLPPGTSVGVLALSLAFENLLRSPNMTLQTFPA